MKKKPVINEPLVEFAVDGDKGALRLLCPLTVQFGPGYDNKLNYREDFNQIKYLEVDFSQVSKIDSYFIIFTNSLKNYCLKNNIDLRYSGMTQDMQDFLKNFSLLEDKLQETILAENNFVKYITNIGLETKKIGLEAKSFIEFFGELLIKFLYLFRNPGQMRWKDFPYHFLRAGVNGLMICLLILFIIGIITGYQGALQLRQFGADRFISDLIGISITRELAPLMVAILVAGRSGSAFAAEIGTMKVSDEIDALRSMGFDYMQFLVLPRVLAVTVAMPFLTILADVTGIVGGLISSLSTLDITIPGYFNELQRTLTYSDLFSGLIKSVVFGFLIAAVGCFQGMQVRGGAESVGKYTTASVVSGILMIIFSDAIFTFLFNSIGV